MTVRDSLTLYKVLHCVFGAAQIDLTSTDRSGHPVKPREWFMVPLHVIDEAVSRITDVTTTGLVYDPAQAKLIDQSGIF